MTILLQLRLTRELPDVQQDFVLRNQVYFSHKEVQMLGSTSLAEPDLRQRFARIMPTLKKRINFLIYRENNYGRRGTGCSSEAKLCMVFNTCASKDNQVVDVLCQDMNRSRRVYGVPYTMKNFKPAPMDLGWKAGNQTHCF
jgi:hypothetical protein